MNTDEPSSVVFPEREEAEWRVLRMQKKLHRWATEDPDHRFDDLANLVYDPAFLVVAWHRVRGKVSTNSRRRWGHPTRCRLGGNGSAGRGP